MRFYLGILAAAGVIFLWGFAIWGNLAAQIGMLRPLEGEGPVAQAILETKAPTGVYIYPMGGADLSKLTGEAKVAAEKALQDKMNAGPIARLFINTAGSPAMGEVLATGFLHMLLAAAIMATLTRSVLSWADFKARYAFVAAVAVFAAIWIDLSSAIWMAAPWDHQLFTAGYDIGAWLLAGVPIAWGTRGDNQSALK
jgi:hypothetical protein